MVKNLPPTQKTQVWSLSWEDPLEKGMATYSSILAWRIPWTEEPGRLQSTGSQRAGHEWATNTLTLLFFHWPLLTQCNFAWLDWERGKSRLRRRDFSTVKSSDWNRRHHPKRRHWESSGLGQEFKQIVNGALGNTKEILVLSSPWEDFGWGNAQIFFYRK